ncbi:MAG: hypothetical protein Q8T08_13305, partial [Ignavibacteria bacterium]|nr:hypothetical protein [Ignavibacteria bacterium]
SYYSCYESPCRSLEGCQLDSARRNRIVSHFLHYNELEYCNEDQCLSFLEYTKEKNSYIFNKFPVFPMSKDILILEKEIENKCIYAFHFKGGLLGAKQKLNDYMKNGR